MSNRPNRTSSRSAKVAQASQAGRSSTLVWVVLAAVVVLAGIVALVVARDSGDDGGSASPSGGTVVPAGDLDYGTVTVEGTPLPIATGTSATTDPAIGEELPTIEGQQFDGSPITIAGDGKPQIVMAIAHWCPHCRAEVPRIQDWLDENGMPTDVDLVAVATATDASRPNFSPGDWLRGAGWSVPTMVDDEDDTAGQALGIGSFPTFVAVGADGRVLLRATGELTMDQWEALLEVARTGEVPS